jgi:hypothetical protein
MKKLNFISVLAVVALLASVSFTSCKENEEPDPYEGKTNPSTIATSNLIAHWGFENSPKDTIARGVATSAVTIRLVGEVKLLRW